jgi:hypothetical protein
MRRSKDLGRLRLTADHEVPVVRRTEWNGQAFGYGKNLALASIRLNARPNGIHHP